MSSMAGLVGPAIIEKPAVAVSLLLGARKWDCTVAEVRTTPLLLCRCEAPRRRALPASHSHSSPGTSGAG